MRNAEGTKWLKAMRKWWRGTGRDLTLPIDGVTSPTRPVGKHQLSFTEGANPFAKLPPGEYKLVVEAAREVGGREVVTVPFKWPAAKAEQLSAKGRSEEHTSELQSHLNLVCRLLLEKKKQKEEHQGPDTNTEEPPVHRRLLTEHSNT